VEPANVRHTDPRLTLAIYAQATTEADRAPADALGSFLSSIPPASSPGPPVDPRRAAGWVSFVYKGSIPVRASSSLRPFGSGAAGPFGGGRDLRWREDRF